MTACMVRRVSVTITLTYVFDQHEVPRRHATLPPREAVVGQGEAPAGLQRSDRSIGILEDRDRSASGHFEAGVRDEDRRPFVDADADESWMIPDDCDERTTPPPLGEVRRDDGRRPQTEPLHRARTAGSLTLRR